MKTTIELPEDLLRRAKATASLRGQSFKELLTDALRDHLARSAGVPAGEEGWRQVFGAAGAAEVEAVERELADLEAVEPESWR